MKSYKLTFEMKDGRKLTISFMAATLEAAIDLAYCEVPFANLLWAWQGKKRVL